MQLLSQATLLSGMVIPPKALDAEERDSRALARETTTGSKQIALAAQ
ncbi:hypothetical protein [Rhizobium sp. A37_96]